MLTFAAVKHSSTLVLLGLSFSVFSGYSLLDRLKTFGNSALLQRVCLAFLLAAAVQGIFIGFLVGEIQKTEKAAAKEFAVLSSSKSLSELGELLRKHRRILDSLRISPENHELQDKFNDSLKHLKLALENYKKSYAATGLDKSICSRISASSELCLASSSSMFAPGKSTAEKQPAHRAYLEASSKLYEEVFGALSMLGNSILQHSDRTNSLDLYWIFGICASGIALVLISVPAINRGISTPLINLSKRCRKLESAEIIEPPNKISNEISTLEQRFHNLSLALHESRQARLAYISLFSGLQSAALQEVKNAVQAQPGMEEKSRQKLQKIETNIDGMFYMLNSMSESLALSGETEIKLQPQPCSTSKIIEQAVLSVQSLLSKKKLSLRIEGEDFEINADEKTLARVLMNLLSNATKFSPSKSEIVIKSENRQGNFYCEVTDQGEGMTAEQQASLFARYSQLDSEHKRSGSGLGLLICKQIVEAHSGEIGCNSSAGAGSSFWFQIPARAVQKQISKDGAGEIKPESKILTSIKRPYLIALAAFLILQIGAAFVLDSRLKDVALKAETYAKQKAVVLSTQELLAQFLTWRQQSGEAIEASDLDRLQKLFPMLSEESAKSKQLLKKVGELNDKRLKNKLEALSKRINGLEKLANKCFEEGIANMAIAAKLIKIADLTGQRIEDDFFSALSLEAGMIDSSYELSAQLRAELTRVLQIIGIGNVLMLLYLLFHTSCILDKVYKLNEKAAQFAASHAIEKTLTGHDELALLDQSLCRTAARLFEAERQRQDLMSMVNHDLRSPLCSVLLSLEMLSKPEKFSKELSDKLDSGAKTLRCLIRQVNDLLEIEKIESGSFSADPAIISLQECFEDLLPKIKSELGYKQEFKLTMPESEELFICFELYCLEKIFYHVISNAINASLESGTEIEISMQKSEQYAIVKVIDKGKGIEKSMQEQLFKRHRTLEGKPHPGLGLPLSFRLMKLNNAELILESSSKSGSTIALMFPLSSAP